MTELTKGGDLNRIIEVSTKQLTEHSLQSELSPTMSGKTWEKFMDGIRNEGILQPLVVTQGFKVIDGKHRLKAARSLGFANVHVVIVDIPDNEIATYISETKLNTSELKPGQKAAIIIRKYYVEERAKALLRKQATQFGEDTDVPEVEQPTEGRTNEILAKKSGVGKSNIAYLLAVYRNRPDLFEKVFNGEYAIGKAHAEMKRDEAPEEVVPEVAPIDKQRKEVEAVQAEELNLPQVDEQQPENSLDNRLVQMRKKALSLTVEVLDESDHMHEAKPEVKDSARAQLLALARTCILALGETTEDDGDADLFAMCFELLKKTNGGLE